ncbi:transcription antitermination factor NusB [Planctomicrobium sp. SH668]|uniref:transcription antitermination factor NusB n=1 Tax=Planctomicrobium sp. SH668 TaxID=3448126 RepID=UPI003F5B8161
MSKRSKARQIAMQMLFQVDLNSDVSGRVVRDMIAHRVKEIELQEFAWRLFSGTMEHRSELDEKIQAVSEKWRLSRMAGTDRAVLRLGAFELLFTATPVGVVINEALELAKKFGSKQSSQFVNGILDRLVPEERRKSAKNEVEESEEELDASESAESSTDVEDDDDF